MRSAICMATLCVIFSSAVTALAGEAKRPWIEQVSWKPRAYLYHNFLSEEEADHIVELATPRIRRSSVVTEKGSVGTDEIRTSYGTFLRPSEDEIIAHIESRVAKWTHLPVSHFENMQVLKYVDGQKYGAHWDEINPVDHPKGLANSSLRVATVLMYLSDVEYGGETAFPHSQWLDATRQNRTEFSPCARDGVAALARKGDAIMFHDMKPGYLGLDLHSMHTGCPVLRGEKWSATFWIHGDDFRSRDSLAGAKVLTPEEVAARACVDRSKDCPEMASRAGGCKDENVKAICQRTCENCCHAGDVLCQRQRRGELNKALKSYDHHLAHSTV